MGATLVINLMAAVLIVLFGFLFVTVSSRLTGEIGSSSNPISGMTVATLLLTCLIFLLLALGQPDAPVDRAFDRGHRLHRVVQRRHDLAGPEDRIPGRRHAQVPAVRHPRGLDFLGPGDRRDPDRAESREHGLYGQEPAETCPCHWTSTSLPVWNTPPTTPRPTTSGRRSNDNDEGVPPGKYLVDDRGQVKYRVDPGITGTLNHRDDGTPVRKLRAADGALCLHHQGHPHAEASLDARAPGGGHCAGAGAQRRALAALRGGRVLAAFLLGADLRGWADALPCRPRRADRRRPPADRGGKRDGARRAACPPVTSRAGPSAPCSSRSCRSATRSPGS